MVTKLKKTLILVLMCLTLDACGEDKQATAKEVSAKSDKTVAQNNNNEIVVEAKNKEWKGDCLKRITNISNLLIGNGKHSSYIYMDPENSGDSLFAAAIGHQGPSGSYLSFMDVAATDNCAADFEIIRVWTNNCQQVAAAEFAQAKVLGQMANGTFMLEVASNAHVYLMPAPNQACISIQKEVRFEKLK